MLNTEQSAGAGAAISQATLSPALIENPLFSFIGDEAGVRRPLFPSPAAEGSTGATAGLSQTKKRESSSEHGLDESTPDSPPSSTLPTGQGPVPSAAAEPGAASATASRKPRGRPPGSRNKQKTATFGLAAGSRLTPHVIVVKTGEDLSEKIISFSAFGPRTVCIMSATGEVSTVTLEKPGTSGKIIKHEGRFDIVSLSGSFMWTEIGGQRCWTGGLNVSLVADGWVLAGFVAGQLIAASPVQVFVGSVTAEDSKSSKPIEVSPAPVKANPGEVSRANSQPSHGTPSESSRGLGSTRQSEEPTPMC